MRYGVFLDDEIILTESSVSLVLCFLIKFTCGLNWYVQQGDSCVKPENGLGGIKYYILLWTYPEKTTANITLIEYFSKISQFNTEACIYNNCLFTVNKKLMNVKYYDAVVFSGISSAIMKPKEFPKRGEDQIYVFDQYEAAERYPLKHKMFDDFFNLTVSYKIDSDKPHTSLCVYDKKGNKIGPNDKIQWKTTNKELSDDLKKILHGKTKLVAWFADHCNASNRRDRFVKKLNVALKQLSFNHSVDIYGDCGNLNCTKNSKKRLEMLSKEYMFYLSFEKSFSEDYVTEKLRNPLQYDTVPIVYGGADYDRFMPPGSYINACPLGPRYLATMMIHLYRNSTQYESYFKWRHLYEVDSCRHHKGHSHTKSICEALNENNFKTHKNFRSWWNGDSKKKCRRS